MYKLMLTTAIAGLAVVSHGAHAQQAAPAQPKAETGDETGGKGLAEIIVTAQFKRESLQKAAVAVAVVSGDQIARAGVTGPTQLTGMVPALQISQGGGNTQAFFIRGVGTLTNNSYTDPGVAFNVDGIYIGRPTSVRNTFFDVERVEVLKGPQGTLYGRNATGGAINVVPAKPVLGQWSGAIGASYGNYNDVGVEGFVNVPLAANMAARVAGTYNRHDGYLSDGTNDADGYALRGQLLFQPTSAVTLRLSGDYAHDGGKGAGATIIAAINPFTGVASSSGLDRSVGMLDARSSALMAGQYNFAAGRFMAGYTGTAPFARNRYWGVKAQADADLGFATLTVLAAHRASDLNGIDFAAGFGARTIQSDHQNSVEARLASPDHGLIRWLAGAYYYDEGVHSSYQFNMQTLTAFQELDTGTKTKAAFGRLTLAPTDHLRLVGGIRFTDEQKRFDGVNPVYVAICNAAIPPIPGCGAMPLMPFAGSADAMAAQMGLVQVTPASVNPGVFIQSSAAAANGIYLRPVVAINNGLSTQKTTFRAAVEYDLAPSNLLYASFENGFHAGGFSFAQIAPSFRPETIDAYTIGSKNRFMGGRLQLNLEAFLWKYRDQQITHFATDTSGAFVYVTENAGSSTNKGFEIEARWRAAQGTVLSLDAQYLDAKYDSFSYTAPNTPTSPPLITGCPTTVLPGAALKLANCSGFTALRSPKWTINAGIEQKIDLPVGQVTLSLDTRYQTRSMIAFEMLPGVTEQQAYSTTNASIEFRPAGTGFVLGAYVANLEDNRAVGQALLNGQTNTFASSPTPPRIYGVRAKYHW